MADSQISILSILFLIFLIFGNAITSEVDITIENDKHNCPKSCKCDTSEIKCSHSLLEPVNNLPESVERMIFEQAISCEESDLERLLDLVISYQIKLYGRCSKPADLAGRSLADVVDNQLQKLGVVENSRTKRSIINQPSIYNFTDAPQITTSCNFDRNLCDWVQLKNTDFFDWTRNRGTTPSASTGPSSDHTHSSPLGYYIYIETSIPRITGQYADIMSPPLIMATNASTVEVKFYYHAYGDALGRLQAFAMYPRYSKHLYPIANVRLTSLNSWRSFGTTFKPLYSTYRIIIRASKGRNYESDIAIDDVHISSIEYSCYSPDSEAYRGSRSSTVSGHACQSWNSQFPHHHNYSESNYPYSGLIGNRCRNPGGLRERPWCYTTSGNKIWDYCDIPVCNPPEVETPEYPLGGKDPVVLVNLEGQPNNIGRLAIYHDGEWGTICYRGLINVDIGLLCKQAGFGPTGRWHIAQNYPGVGKVWLEGNNLICPATADTFLNCTIKNWGSSCSHALDTWVKCDGECTTCVNQTLPTLAAATATPNPTSSYILSIRGGPNSTMGWVQVNNRVRLGVICTTNWNLYSADVACRQMGYVGAFTSRPPISNLPSGMQTIIGHISCYGYESIIDECSLIASTSLCQPSRLATISCYRESPFPSNSLNTNHYCSFRNGFCRWKNEGRTTWVWHNRNGRHFNPLSDSAYLSFIYLYKARQISSGMKAVLISPMIYNRRFRTQYVTVQYRVYGTAFNHFEISFKAEHSGHPIYRLGSLDTTSSWRSVDSSSFYPHEDFQIKLVCESSAGSVSSQRSIIAIRRIGVLYGNPSSAYVNVPGIVIGSSVGGVVAIVIIAVACRVSHKKRSKNTTIVTGNNTAETPAVATNTNIQPYTATTTITTNTQEKIPLTASTATVATAISSDPTLPENATPASTTAANATTANATPANATPANATTANVVPANATLANSAAANDMPAKTVPIDDKPTKTDLTDNGVNVAVPDSVRQSSGIYPSLQSETPGVTYVMYGAPQVAQAGNQSGYVAAQPGYRPGQMTYAVSYNASNAVPVPQTPDQPPGYQGLFPQQNDEVSSQQQNPSQSTEQTK